MDDILGGALKKDATDCHVTISGDELIWRDEPMFHSSFHHLVAPDNAESHIQGSTYYLNLMDVVDLDWLNGVIFI